MRVGNLLTQIIVFLIVEVAIKSDCKRHYLMKHSFNYSDCTLLKCNDYARPKWEVYQDLCSFVFWVFFCHKHQSFFGINNTSQILHAEMERGVTVTQSYVSSEHRGAELV